MAAPVPAQATLALDQPLAALERGLAAVSDALREHDASHLEAAAGDLHQAVAAAAAALGRSAKQAPMSAGVRQRLLRASAYVAAQRVALARASASVDRALHLLLPTPTPTTYAAGGVAERPQNSGSTTA